MLLSLVSYYYGGATRRTRHKFNSAAGKTPHGRPRPATPSPLLPAAPFASLLLVAALLESRSREAEGRHGQGGDRYGAAGAAGVEGRGNAERGTRPSTPRLLRHGTAGRWCTRPQLGRVECHCHEETVSRAEVACFGVLLDGVDDLRRLGTNDRAPLPCSFDGVALGVPRPPMAPAAAPGARAGAAVLPRPARRAGPPGSRGSQPRPRARPSPGLRQPSPITANPACRCVCVQLNRQGQPPGV